MIGIVKKIIIAAILALTGIQLAAQVSSASATLERDSLMIGDQVMLKLEAIVPNDHLISWPTYNDTLIDRIEIINKTLIDTMASDKPGFKKYFQDLLITGFDSGTYRVPPIRFYHGAKDDTVTEMLVTRPFYIRVHTMEVDTSQAIKPIKPPLKAPYTISEFLPWILPGLGLILIGLLIYYYLMKRRSAESMFKLRSKPRLPAHVIALNGLEELRMKKLWQEGKVKEYYSIMTDIVRAYMEERFGINAIEMTTDEIMSGLKKTAIEKDLQARLGQTLVLADLVKFAKENPLPLDNDNCLDNSIRFVRETIPVQKMESEGQEVMDNVQKEEIKTDVQ
jgi:hypothetical protein